MSLFYLNYSLSDALCFGRRDALVFYIEGNVGVGKTECAQVVAKTLRSKGVTVGVLTENVDGWLECGYFDDARSDAGSQTLTVFGVLDDHLRRYHDTLDMMSKCEVVLVERHPTTTMKVFEPPEHTKKLFERIADVVPGFLSSPENTIYIKNSARVCHERTARRARKGETALEELAFDTWHQRLEDMMREREASGGKVYTLTLSALNRITCLPPSSSASDTEYILLFLKKVAGNSIRVCLHKVFVHLYS